MTVAVPREMKPVLGWDRDPLLLLLLSSIGALELGGCGGRSARDVSDSADNAGTSGMALPPPETPLTTEGVLGCESPVLYPLPAPAPSAPSDTGFTSCAAGFIHRRVALTCPQPAADPGVDCSVNCADTNNGRCLPSTSSCMPPRCVSECQSDADCADDELCLCDATVNHCVPADCRSDGDCGDGLLCIGFASSGVFACQTSADECTTSCPTHQGMSDGQSVDMWGRCNLVAQADGSQRRTCFYSTNLPSCGRPFLVMQRPRLADVTRRGDWAAVVPRGLRVRDLPAAVRGELARSYTEMAQMEHASIAAFARFSLQLLAFGAPADLVRDAARAGLDEQRHAELCFGIASAYAGEAIGPGALAVQDCLGDVSLASVALTTFLEGCIGETVAAVEARELARSTRDSVLATELARIAEDESRHAALAWRFVSWALERIGPGLATAFARALETERSRAADAASPLHANDEVMLGFGLLRPAQRARLRRLTLETIVAPCLAALGRRTPPRVGSLSSAGPESAAS